MCGYNLSYHVALFADMSSSLIHLDDSQPKQRKEGLLDVKTPTAVAPTTDHEDSISLPTGFSKPSRTTGSTVDGRLSSLNQRESVGLGGAGLLKVGMLLGAAQKGGDLDLDSSLHEVKIDDEELMQFDEDFSDLDDTLLDNKSEPSPEAATRGSGERNRQFLQASFSAWQEVQVSQGQREVGRPYGAVEDREEFQNQDMLSEQQQYAPARSFSDDLQAGWGQRAEGHSFGEGQESDDEDRQHFFAGGEGRSHTLDPIYFTPSSMVHQGGDGEEDHAPRRNYSQGSVDYGGEQEK